VGASLIAWFAVDRDSSAVRTSEELSINADIHPNSQANELRNPELLATADIEPVTLTFVPLALQAVQISGSKVVVKRSSVTSKQGVDRVTNGNVMGLYRQKIDHRSGTLGHDPLRSRRKIAAR
jgi:hypothetical protein